MRRENLKRAAALFGVVLPALVAGAEESGKTLTKEESIDFCVDMREKTAECKEEFADHFASMGPPERREAIRKKVLEELVADGTGPREPRRQKCAAQAERKPPSYKQEDVKEARKCFAEKDCKTAFACLKPLIDKQMQRKPPK